MTQIKFRPHHFLCTIAFQGKGYSPEFVDNYTQICEQLNADQGDCVQIQVVNQTDSICCACPDKHGELCRTQSRVEALDNQHAQVLNLKAGMALSWGEAKRQIAEKIDEKVFDSICQGCSWKDLGICLTALKRLRERFNKL